MQGRIQIRQSLVKTTFSSAEEEKGQIKVGWGKGDRGLTCNLNIFKLLRNFAKLSTTTCE